MTPFNYDSLDPGIRDLVRHLNELGYPTTDSGDGVSKSEMGCALPFRHVVIVPLDGDFAASVLARQCHDIKDDIEAFDIGHKWMVEATYSTAGNTRKKGAWFLLASEFNAADLAEATA